MSARILPDTPEAIAEAVWLLRDGALVAFPTETVYGLGADASNARALARLFRAKGRPADHPVIVHLATAAELPRWAAEVPPTASALVARFWPGPLTLILKRDPRVSLLVTGGQDSVGLRVPAHPVAHALLEAFGGGIAAPSANRFGRVSPTRAEHVASEMGRAVALIIDGGDCDVGIESTILDLTSDCGRATLLRPGGVGIVELTMALGYVPLPPTRAAPRASGTLASHYAPTTPSLMVPKALLDDALAQARAEGRTVALLLRSDAATAHRTGGERVIAAGTDPRDYARGLYRHLRALDQSGADLIVVEAPPDLPEWQAVNDRLRRATWRGESM